MPRRSEITVRRLSSDWSMEGLGLSGIASSFGTLAGVAYAHRPPGSAIVDPGTDRFDLAIWMGTQNGPPGFLHVKTWHQAP